VGALEKPGIPRTVPNEDINDAGVSMEWGEEREKRFSGTEKKRKKEKMMLGGTHTTTKERSVRVTNGAGGESEKKVVGGRD